MDLNFDHFHITKTNIKHILRAITLSECAEYQIDKFNLTYENQEGSNIVKNICPPVLMKDPIAFKQEIFKYKFWVRNHAICNFVEELHNLFIEILYFIELHDKKICDNSVLHDAKTKCVNKYRSFSDTLVAISSTLKLNEEYVESIKSLIEIRNAITHDRALATKTQKRNRSKLTYYCLYLKERKKSDKLGHDDLVLARKKEDKLFTLGEGIQFTYQETNDIADTILKFINKQLIQHLKLFSHNKL